MADLQGALPIPGISRGLPSSTAQWREPRRDRAKPVGDPLLSLPPANEMKPEPAGIPEEGTSCYGDSSADIHDVVRTLATKRVGIVSYRYGGDTSPDGRQIP
jgi:hypothetical protein